MAIAMAKITIRPGRAGTDGASMAAAIVIAPGMRIAGTKTA